MLLNSIVGLALLAPASAEYVWPSKFDSMEDLLYLQSGYIRNGALSDQVLTCGFGAGQPGIQKSAEWVRTAFHDAATHDSSTKVGGLDGSIQYELDRVENLGSALNSTLADISSSVNVYSSAADVLSLSLVMAVARCGNLYVPLRLGRIDATEAGIKGVPEAHTDLETTKNRFAIAGFNESEMITLVACGHTLGGVHSVDHPEIVTGPVAPENVARFDTTTAQFDNAVVSEFLNDTTANPLIRNANDTLNSDKRIFTSDRNVTMTRLADPAFFKAQCESLFERMIDLVPGDITLSEPLKPADVKPYITSYQLKNDNVEFAGRIRVYTSESTGRVPTDLTVTIIPTDRNGVESSQEITTRLGTFKGGNSFGYLREQFHWFEFNQTIPASSGIKSFNVRLTTPSTGATTLLNNANTGGYPVNKDIIFQDSASCIEFDTATQEGKITIVTAISKALLADGNPTPQLNFVHRTKVQGNFIPRLNREIVPLERAGKETSEYEFWKAVVTVTADGLGTSFDIEVGDVKEVFYQTNGMLGRACTAL